MTETTIVSNPTTEHVNEINNDRDMDDLADMIR